MIGFDGDRFFSIQDRRIWQLVYSTIEKFQCMVTFRKTGPFAPLYRDCHIHFFVPQHHSRAEEVKQYLEHESKALLYVKRQTDDCWYPNTTTRVFFYSGLESYMDRDTTEESVEYLYDSLLQSLRDERSKPDEQS